MPRPGPKRPLVNVRLSQAEVDQLRKRAERETDGNVSELMRRMLTYAARKMPRGWDGEAVSEARPRAAPTVFAVPDPPVVESPGKPLSKADQTRKLREARYNR